MVRGAVNSPIWPLEGARKTWPERPRRLSPVGRVEGGEVRVRIRTDSEGSLPKPLNLQMMDPRLRASGLRNAFISLWQK